MHQTRYGPAGPPMAARAAAASSSCVTRRPRDRHHVAQPHGLRYRAVARGKEHARALERRRTAAGRRLGSGWRLRGRASHTASSVLPPGDLTALLTHRPEAAALAASGRVTWGALASALAAPRGVHDALASLDRFLDQVLQLACVYGGRLEPGTAAAEGLDATALAAGAAALRSRGLAFSEADGTMVVPRNVEAQIPNPGGLGARAATFLEHLTLADLRPLATTLDVPQPRLPLRKGDLVHRIALRLADRDAVRALLAGAPAKARAALAELRAAGGSSGALAASSIWQRSYEWHPRRTHAGGAADGAAWLLAHGLVLSHDEWSDLVSVPLEVELALRGRVFAAWQPDPPALPLVALRQVRHPAELVAEMDALLNLWRHDPPPALQNGGVPKRELKRAARTLGLAEEWVGEVAGLALAAGLLAEREVTPEKRSRSYRDPHVLQSRRAVIEVAAGGWDDLSPAERWLAVVRAWSKAAMADPYVGRAWRHVLALLAELPEGRGVDAAHLGARLAWCHPASFTAAAASHAALVGSTLSALGLGGAEPAIGLGAIGRAVILGDRPLDPALLDDAFPAPVETCTVTADHRVVVAGAPAQALAGFLALIADLVSVHPAHVYRLSDSSLRRALDDAPPALPRRAGLPLRDPRRGRGARRMGTRMVLTLGASGADGTGDDLAATPAANGRRTRYRFLATFFAVAFFAKERRRGRMRRAVPAARATRGGLGPGRTSANSTTSCASSARPIRSSVVRPGSAPPASSRDTADCVDPIRSARSRCESPRCSRSVRTRSPSRYPTLAAR